MKSFYKNCHKLPNKHQEFINKAKLYNKKNNKLLKYLTNYRKRKLSKKSLKRRKEQGMVLTIKTIQNGHPQNGSKTKRFAVNKHSESYQYLSVS